MILKILVCGCFCLFVFDVAVPFLPGMCIVYFLCLKLLCFYDFYCVILDHLLYIPFA